MSSALMCPSSLAKPNAELFGVLDASGQVEYLEQSIQIDETFIDAAKEGRNPEEIFRFASNCIKNGCHQWDSNHQGCGLVGRIIENMNKKAQENLVHCAIRPRCRWYHQEAEQACMNCNEVVRNFRAMELSQMITV